MTMREHWRTMSRLGRAVLTFAAAGVVMVAALVAAFLWLPALGTPSEAALQYSLTRAVEGNLLVSDSYACAPSRSSTHSCTVADSQGSGAATYSVRLDGRCWHAQKRSPDAHEEGPPYLKRRAEGCVRWRDQLRLLQNRD